MDKVQKPDDSEVLHNLLNVVVQTANKVGLQEKSEYT
jgi:hypothetical protein